MDLNLLVAFEALHRERSVTRAGRALGLSQPATSAVLARVRAAFDDDLFVRTPHGLEPTSRADALAGPIARALDDLRAALGEGAFDPRSATDTFRLGAVDAVLAVLLGPVAANVMREAPRVRLDVRPVDPGDAGILFETRRLDFLLAPVAPIPAHLAAKDLFHVDLVLAMRPGHPLARAAKRTPDLAALARYPHVVVSFAGPARTPIDDALATAGLERHVAAVLGSFSAVPHLLATTDAVCIVPGPMARALAATGALAFVPLPPELPRPRLTMRLVWPTRFDRSAPHVWLREIICEAARAPAARAASQ